MEYIVIASGVALAVGLKMVSLIWELRDTFARPKPVELNPLRLHEPRPGDHEGRPTRSSHC